VTWNSLADLLHACIEGSEPAWEEFVRRFHPVIVTVMRCAKRFGETTPERIDGLIQETMLMISANRCAVLRDWEPRSPYAIFGFVKAVAFRVTVDYFRIGMAEKCRSEPADAVLGAYAKSAVAGSKGLPKIQREILFRRIDEHLATLADPITGPRDRRIFWLYYRHGMTARRIASIPRLGRTRDVERVIQRLTRGVRGRFEEGEL
jgi:RNA polymerase sigma-70 factor (ECF subfamily)